ncbi:hypothetical protein PAXRUDRAFT_36944 [Paxillus rubicundulus Ve08.2h10]|uniref:DUF6589 domain-containing protein n=1 Tax=Paxillus rubicundulus Ve08.2h10 TaxID=930991 RepID=A0A0D0D781_9AGAM|nr:hypothetical protein PAXRUDRAFT_36944 [Paxillus rubicundulus Ve08.2h10]
MQDNMLVNLTGLKCHFMPIDLNIEYLIKFLKVGHSLGIAYHSITHITPNTSHSVRKVAYKLQELELHIFVPDRMGNDSVKPVVNILTSREQKLKSSTLATFNRKVRSMMVGEGIESEEDEIPPALFKVTHPEVDHDS